MRFKCVSDRYGPSITYNKYSDFISFCEKQFEFAPRLIQKDDGYHDYQGLVLVEVEENSVSSEPKSDWKVSIDVPWQLNPIALAEVVKHALDDYCRRRQDPTSFIDRHYPHEKREEKLQEVKKDMFILNNWELEVRVENSTTQS